MMTAREIIESVGAKYMGERETLPHLGPIVYFESPEIPGATMSLFVRRIQYAEYVRNHIAWKRKEFGK